MYEDTLRMHARKKKQDPFNGYGYNKNWLLQELAHYYEGQKQLCRRGLYSGGRGSCLFVTCARVHCSSGIVTCVFTRRAARHLHLYLLL
jgi:hypothetical protein